MTILVNRAPIIGFTFPGGEEHVRLTDIYIGNKTFVYASLKSSNDVMALMLTVDAIYRIRPETKIFLTIPYLPYARQDRVCHDGEALSIKVMCNMINLLKCHEVVIIDPHSDVAPALINNVRIIHQADIVANSELTEIIQSAECDLVSPDAGSLKKCTQVQKKLLEAGVKTQLYTASKKRNPENGKITQTEVTGDIKNKNLIIVDDICDGGRTFVALADELKKKGANKVFLYVTHGIFSQGLEPLIQSIDEIICYHSLNAELQDEKPSFRILNSFAKDVI